MGRVYVGPALGFTFFHLRLLSHSLLFLLHGVLYEVCIWMAPRNAWDTAPNPNGVPSGSFIFLFNDNLGLFLLSSMP